MKMSTSDDFPSGRVPGQDPGSFLVATEACGGGTPDLGYFLEVWGFIGEVGVENKSGPPRRVHEAQGRALHPHGPHETPLRQLLVPVFFIFFKKISVDFHRIPRTSISAQIQYHGSSAENSISPG